MSKIVSITHIADFEGGTQPPKSEFIDIPQTGYIRLLQIRDFEKDSNAVYIKDKPTLKKCESDDILMGRYGASVGKVLTGKTGAYNVALMKIIPKKEISKRFVYYVLKSAQFQSFIKIISESRVAQAGFNKKDLSRFFFSLPEKSQQEKIALQLDLIQDLIDKRIKSLELLGKVQDSVFFKMFGDVIHNQKKFKKEKLKNIVKPGKIITYGIVQPGPNIKGGVPYIRSGEIQNGEIKYEHLPLTSKKIAEKHIKSCCEVGDIILSIRASVGECAVIPLNLNGVNLSREIARIVPNNKIIDTYYLYQCLSSKAFKFILNKFIKGTIYKGISLEKLREIEIPIPDIELQRNFSLLYKKLIDQKTLLTRSLKILESLFQSILQNAFKEDAEINEEPIFKELITQLNLEDLRGNKKRLQYLIDLFTENKFDSEESYSGAKEKLFELILKGEIEQVFDADKIMLNIK